jgi:probable rRNA maturation factor
MKNNFRLLVDSEGFSDDYRIALEKALAGFVASDVALAFEIEFVSEEEIRELNAQTRGIDKVTDVLSYPSLDGIKGQKLSKKDYPYSLDEDGNLLVGSIAVCVKRATEQAEEYGHSLERELHYLIVHGVMHCLGYDHERDEDKAEMREKEEYILKKLGITR